MESQGSSNHDDLRTLTDSNRKADGRVELSVVELSRPSLLEFEMELTKMKTHPRERSIQTILVENEVVEVSLAFSNPV